MCSSWLRSWWVPRGLADGTRDAFGATCARWEHYTALLESTQRIWGLPDNLRVRYLTGLLFSLGMMGPQRDDPRTLEIAERLDRTGAALYPVNTDQLRAIHYGHQGNAKLYRHYRELSEQHVIQHRASA